MPSIPGVAGLIFLLSACGGAGYSQGGIPVGGGGGGGGPIGSPPSSSRIAIQPMTEVNVSSRTGYFQDPYPIHSLMPTSASGLPTFSGTTKQLLSCSGPMQPKCFTSRPITLDAGPFAQQANGAGSMINNFEGLNIYQDSAGRWQMAVTAHLKNGRAGWNVILHAHPTSMTTGIPTAWVADTLLIGDLGRFAPDNYNGKYIEDSGTLYLIYNKKVGDHQDGVVAQAMTSATQLAARAPVPLLGPETANGGYNSELANGLDQPNPVKLIETGNVTRINGKYAMAYSVGTFNRPGYKSGIAWSDSFLPPPGTYYKRVRKVDTAGLWGRPGHAEVQYLLQSQIPRWPNYVASQVISPGVPAIVSDKAGNHYLTFAGYDPSDAPTAENGLYRGNYRRPYYVRLKVQIPPASKVSETSAQDLATWVVPETRP